MFFIGSARYYDPQLGRWWSVDPVDEYDTPYLYVGNSPTVAIDKDGNITDWLTIGNNKTRGTGYFGFTGTRPVKHNPNEPWWLSAPVWVLAGSATFITGGIVWGAVGFTLETYAGLYFANTISGSLSNTLFNDYKNPNIFMKDVMAVGFFGGLSSTISFGITKWFGTFLSIPFNSFISTTLSKSEIDFEVSETHVWSSLLLQGLVKTTVGADILSESITNYMNIEYNDNKYNFDGGFYTVPADKTATR